MKTVLRNLLLLVMAATTNAIVLGAENQITASNGKKDDQTTYHVSHNEMKPPAVEANEVRVANRSSFVRGQIRQYDWCVARVVMEKQPRWDGLTTEPPLSARKAAALALPNVQRRFPEVKEWLIRNITLRNQQDGDNSGQGNSYLNVWVYEVTFMPKDKKAGEKIGFEAGFVVLTEVVLLDGTVVSPRIVK